MKNKSVRVILSMLLNICIVTVGVFIIYAAGSRAYTFGHNIFDEDAIVLEETSGQVLLHSLKGKKGVRVDYPDMPYIGFWHMPCTDAPYVCIEPWCSLPSRQGITEDLEKQENLLSLESGKERQVSWTMEII